MNVSVSVCVCVCMCVCIRLCTKFVATEQVRMIVRVTRHTFTCIRTNQDGRRYEHSEFQRMK